MKKLRYSSKEEWLALRKNYIGGSDAGAVAGLNPHKGAVTVWAEKLGKVEEFQGNLITEIGSFLEEKVAELFCRETGKSVRRDNFMLVNEDYPFACADVDRRIVGENALLECKTTNSFENMKLIASGDYPAQWYCQMMHYLAVTGCDRCYLAVLIGCREFKMFTCERNEDEIKALMEMEAEFWTHVQDVTPPAASYAKEETETLQTVYADTVEGVMDATPYCGLLSQYETAKAEADNAQNRADELKNQIIAAMGEFTEARYEGYKVTYKPSTRSNFDRKSFEKENPDVNLAPYFKESVSRRFIFTKTENK